MSVKKSIFDLHNFSKSPWDEFEEENVFSKMRKKKADMSDGLPFEFNYKTILLLIISICAFWLLSGFYRVEEGSEGVVTRFGKFSRISTAGFNYHIPNPIEAVRIEEVNKSRRIEIGYVSSTRGGFSDTNATRDVPSESIMLTGDENIVAMNADIMWHIGDLRKFIFNVKDPKNTVKAVAESAIREVIGKIPIASVLSNQKQEIADAIEKLMEHILDSYDIGVKIEQVQLLKVEPPKEVIQSYRDVQTARADKERQINKAYAYSNDILPRARGEAAKILQNAEGYKAAVVAEAKGNVARFNNIYMQYINNKDVMRSRMYIDTLEEILKNNDKVIMGAESVLPHMSVK